MLLESSITSLPDASTYSPLRNPFERKRETPASSRFLEGKTQPHSPPERWDGRRSSQTVVPPSFRPPTFRRQYSELRDVLTPSGIIDFKIKTATKARSDRRRALTAKPVQDEVKEPGYAVPNEAADVVETDNSTNKITTVSNDTSAQTALLDEQLQHELDTKWILNLSMHFRDKSGREKFFVTYAETPTKWRRLTVSCDYRNAPPDSLEHDLKELHNQRDRSAMIYEGIRSSLPDIQFYDTVTNLKLETREERLHVHVAEDLNEIIQFPADQLTRNVGVPRVPESQIQLISHISGYMYKVRVGEDEFIQKGIPGPDSVDDFLYELKALESSRDSHHIKLEGLVVNEKLDVIKGLLIRYAKQTPLVHGLEDINDTRAVVADSGGSSGMPIVNTVEYLAALEPGGVDFPLADDPLSLTRQSRDLSLLGHFQDYEFSRSTHQLDRTMSDIYQDELYDPGLVSSSLSSQPLQQQQSQVKDTISTTHTSVLSDRLRKASNERMIATSASVNVSASRQPTPFRQNSPFAPDEFSHSAPSSLAGMGQQQQLESKLDDPSSHNGHFLSPKTISPKEAFLDYHETEEEHGRTPKHATANAVDVHIQKARLTKFKQGLVGFANGADIAAMADTGSRKNIISASYAKKLGLKVEGSPSPFKIGNAQKIQSLGTVSLLWAFAENPKETFSILCDVLPRCTYDLILGNGFLSATETMSKFRHRLTKCLFSVINNVPQFGFLGETYQRLGGFIADEHAVLAIPDTGADRNVMSLQYAIDHGLELKSGPKHRGYLQFADGSFDETVGQVETYWTFVSGERIPVTFEVLEYCCSDVIIGEDVLTEYNVFQEHAASIISDVAFDSDCYELAPFDFVNSWQRGCEKLMDKVAFKKDSSQRRLPAADAKSQEQHRRNVWNHKYDFGASATTGEKELELARRERYESGQSVPQARMPMIPSIPTSQSRR